MALAPAESQAYLERRSGGLAGTALTAAESEVAALVLAGRRNAEIAAARGTSLRTVANQVASVFRKLGVGSRLHLTASVSRDRSCVRPGVTITGPLPSWQTLTHGESAVLFCAAHGASYKAIAYELGISVGLVGRRLAAVARKVGARSRIELVAAYWQAVQANRGHEELRQGRAETQRVKCCASGPRMGDTNPALSTPVRK